MSKLTLNSFVNGDTAFNNTTTLNNNNDLIKTAIENTLSRDGTTPNTMSADLDMNGHRILNTLAIGGSGFVWQGPWVTTTAYSVNYLVSYQGNTYICTTAHTSNNFAVDLAANKWSIIASKGADGAGTGVVQTVGVSGASGFSVSSIGTSADPVVTTAIDSVLIANNKLIKSNGTGIKEAVGTNTATLTNPADYVYPLKTSSILKGNAVTGALTAAVMGLDYSHPFSNAMYTTSTNVGNAYLIDFPTVTSPGGMFPGDTYTFKVSATNTGPVTFAVKFSGLTWGGNSLLKRGGVPLVAGDLVANAIVTVVYNGTNFQLRTIPSVDSVTVNTAFGFTGTTTTTTPSAPVLNIKLQNGLNTILRGTDGAGTIGNAVAGTHFIAPSAYASANGLTMSTAKLLGRSTAATGAAEEITVGSGLLLSGGNLSSVSGGGTVTNVSVVTTNGFAGSVSNPTGNAAITLSCTIPGILKSNGTAISDASGATNTWTGFNTFTFGTTDPGTLTFERRGFNIAYTSQTGGASLVRSGLVIDAKTQTTSNAFEWGFLSRLSNYADSTTGSENVAIYGQGYKYSSGNTWAGVFEAQDYSLGNTGSLYGLELDVWASGAGASNRFGIGFNFGTVAGGSTPTIDYGIDFAPNANNRTSAQLANGLRFMLDCTVANMVIANGATTPAIVDITSAGNISSFLKLASSNTIFTSAALGTYIGKIRTIIDGTTYYMPIYT